MKTYKAPRKVKNFTSVAGKKLANEISRNHFNHYITIESIENNLATLKIHKFKTCKGKPAKDYKATVQVLRFWHGKIADFENFKIV